MRLDLSLRQSSALLLICVLISSHAQPGTDVYLFDLRFAEDHYEISNPINISSNPGYDNQPSFSSDGQFLYYTSWQQDEQTDIIAYDIGSGKKRRVTRTDGSEYSPTEMPGGGSLSTILLERDGTQLLWKVNVRNGKSSVLVPGKKIGYHCWSSKDHLFSFVLGEPNTLQYHELKSGEHTVLDSMIGRSLHKIPTEPAISYVSKKSEPWMIRKYQPESGKAMDLTPTVTGSEDLAWTGNGHILMGRGQELLWWSKTTGGWRLLADLSEHNIGNITRLAVNPSSTQLALVGND